MVKLKERKETSKEGNPRQTDKSLDSIAVVVWSPRRDSISLLTSLPVQPILSSCWDEQAESLDTIQSAEGSGH